MTDESSIIRSLYDELMIAPTRDFPEEGLAKAPIGPGVYVIYGPIGNVRHVGKTNSGLRQRLGDHLRGSSSFVRSGLLGNRHSLRQGHSFRFLEVDCPRKRALLEALAIGLLCPEHVGTGEKRLPPAASSGGIV